MKVPGLAATPANGFCGLLRTGASRSQVQLYMYGRNTDLSKKIRKRLKGEASQSCRLGQRKLVGFEKM